MARGYSTILFQIDTASGIPKQTQIREYFVRAILNRSMAAGEPLPSTRQLAEQLGVSRNTVILAYQALTDSGYIDPVSRSGFVVSSDAPVTAIDDADGQASGQQPTQDKVNWRQKLIHEPTALNIVRKPLNWREYKYPFNYGQIDPDLFSHSEWRDCARQALGIRDFSITAGDFGHNDDPLLVDYICSYSLPRRGIRVPSDRILVTLGAQNALFLLAQLLVDRNTRVVIEDPFYPDMRELLQRRTPHITTLPVDDNGIIIDEEKIAAADIVIVTPSHQCPTTATLSLERRQHLLELAVTHDVLIIEDDYEFEMNFLEAPSPALKSLDESGHVIYVGSFSKSLFPGLRLGYLVASEELIEEARALRHLMLRHPPGQTQRTAAYFMALGHYDSQIKRLRRHFNERRQLLKQALAEESLLEETGSHFGGTSFWIRGPAWLDSRDLAQHAAAKGVLIEPGDTFFNAPEPPYNYFRLAYSSIHQDNIIPGFRTLIETVNSLTP
ncbi:MAG: PLP-dependent aminotransferase family protein [Candidatus Puniceispirillales bacterium]